MNSTVTDGGWTLRRVQETIGLSRHAIAGLIAQGFVTPSRGPRNALQFSFQDLVLLRTAFELRSARIAPRAILQALSNLRDELPSAVPLTGLRITAEGANVVVRDGGLPRDAATGQLMMDFAVVHREDGGLTILRSPGCTTAPMAGAAAASSSQAFSAEKHFLRGETLEPDDRNGAKVAYRQAIALDATLLPAYVSLGALLCEEGSCSEAVALFEQALSAGVADALLHFNHAIALEDVGEATAAQASYLAALALDRRLADAHFNLARLLQADGDVKGALRHWSAYKRIQREDSADGEPR